MAKSTPSLRIPFVSCTLNPSMLDNLTQRLGQGRQDPARPGPPDRGQHRRHAARSAHGAARSRRRPAGGQGLHRPRQGKGARPGSHRLADAGPGTGRRGASRTDRADGRRQRRPQPRHPAAGDHPDGRPAGRGQDHDDRQARQVAQGTAEEEGAGGQLRRLSPGRHRAVEGGVRAGRHRFLPLRSRPEARRHRRRRARLRQAPLLRRAVRRYRRPAGHRRSDDGRDQASCMPC